MGVPSNPKKGPVVVITGASMGLGAALARRWARSRPGSRLVLTARSQEKLMEVARDCKRAGSEAYAISCDVTREPEVKRMIEETVSRYGGIDVLVLNAGMSMHVPFEDLRDTRIFHMLMAVNYFGYVYPTFYALPYLRQSLSPSIVVIGSLSGETGVPLRTAYCGSKFAVNGFFEALRCEIGDSVPITIVSPNYVDTEIRRNGYGPEDFRPVKHMMTADEAADIILQAHALRRRKVIMTMSGKLAVALRPFLPQLVDYVVTRKAGFQSSSSAGHDSSHSPSHSKPAHSNDSLPDSNGSASLNSSRTSKL